MTKLGSFIKSFFCLCAFLVFNNTGFAFSGAGGGISSNPYKITSCNQLIEIANEASAYYQLDNDVDCTAHGAFTASVINATFSGNFNGNFHTISGITINTALNQIGLFNQLNSAGSPVVVSNLKISGASITATANEIGILAGRANNSLITNVFVAGSISGNGTLGGLLGSIVSSNTISSCASNVIITTNSSNGRSGGLIGDVGSGNTITDSYSTGDVNGTEMAGGLLGAVEMGMGSPIQISNCYSSGHVTGTFSVGGLVGFAQASIENSFSVGQVTNLGGGGTGGFLGADSTLSLTGNYFDIFTSNQSNGVQDANVSGCTGVNASNSNPNYFTGNNTNPPMNGWAFPGTWVTANGALPLLNVFAPTATPTPTATFTSTATPTITSTSTSTATPTASLTPTSTSEATATITPTATATPVATATALATATSIGKPNNKLPSPTISIRKKNISITLRDSLRGERNYYVIVINTLTEKLFKQLKVNIRNGLGTVKLNNSPAGTFRVYYYVKYSRGIIHSKAKNIIIN